MTIKFPCPHCKKMLSVKEHLAGKKAACPSCKQPITIPTPATTPAVPEPDMEELAAAAFADEPVKKEEAAPQFIEFKCFYCEEQVKVSAELGGKQAPCPNPECRRIVKIPQLVKEGPKDWRKVDTRTPLVAQRNEPAPEGAWGSTVATGNVSRKSLEEAAALPTAAPAGVKPWLIRSTLVAVLLLIVAGGWWGIGGWMHTRLETQQVAKVEAYLKDEASAKPEEAAAELERAVGEYYLRMQKPEQARIRFGAARARLTELTSRERDCVLANVAAHQADLGGVQKEVDDGVRLPWEQALREVVQTLVKIRHADIRVDAVREVSRRLIARGEGRRAASIAAQVGTADEVPELVAVAGLELFAANMLADANLSADLALQRFQEPLAGDGEPMEPAGVPGDAPGKAKEAAGSRKMPIALIALWVALDRHDAKAKFPPPAPTAVGSAPLLIVGHVEGLGYRGDHARARATLDKTTTVGKVQAHVALAEACLAMNQLDAAKTEIESALAIFEREPGGKNVSNTILARLVQVGARCGLAEQVKVAAAAITDKEQKSRAQLEIYRARLAGTRERQDIASAEEVDPPAYPLALEALARHNARVDSPRSTRNAVDGWDSEKHRPFGWIGTALGSRDGAR